MSYQDVLVLFALLLRFDKNDKKLFYLFMFQEPISISMCCCTMVVNTQQALWLFDFLV